MPESTPTARSICRILSSLLANDFYSMLTSFVQVWFQNRRQTDRRRSRPLLPHELVPHFRNGVPLEVLQHSPYVSPVDHEARYNQHAPIAGQVGREEVTLHSPTSSIHELLNPPSSSESKVQASASSTQERVHSNTSPISSFGQLEEHFATESTAAGTIETPELDESTSSARKRAHAEMTGPVSTSVSAHVQQLRKVSSQGSMVRLSMTPEGAVKVRMSNQETPSPPKARALSSRLNSPRSSSLQRSNSAVGAAEMAQCNSKPKAADGKLGRSRDARTWEFYCDSEARDTLSSHAEHERNGSAVGAINLIRSQSQRQLRQMLAPLASRSNVRVPAPLGSNAQRSKPKLARAKSSLARLQGADVEFAKSSGKDLRPQIERSPSGDSDKENWAPGTHASQHPLRRTHVNSNGRPVLADNDSALSYASKLDRNDYGMSRRLDEKENLHPMSREKGSDLDCVQGLLSLSQGAWR